MKYVIASDIHGNLENLRELFRRMIFEKPSKIILLGDLYYHGPRNPLPKSYNSLETAKFLNEHKKMIVAIRGNCDAEVDESISEFKLKNNLKLTIGDKRVFLTHGHNMDEVELLHEFDILIYGHTHSGFIKRWGKKLVANCGSVGLPKNNTPKSYLVLDEKSIILKDFLGKIIDSALI